MSAGRQRTLREKWHLTSLSNKTISISTVVIAAASVLTFGTAVLQWYEMRNASTQTDRIIAEDKRLADAMENNVKQAGNSLNTTIAQNQLDQRAWISATEVSGNPEVGKPWIVQITFRNTGKTIARNVRARNTSDQVLRGKQPDYKLVGVPGGRGILSPASFAVTEIKISKGTPLPQAIFDKYKAEDIRLFIYGEILYDDIFGKSHYTTYCSVYTTSTGFWACETHNDAN